MLFILLFIIYKAIKWRSVKGLKRKTKNETGDRKASQKFSGFPPNFSFT